MAVVVFEGADASGKDTLKDAVEQRSGYAHNCVMRFGFSQLVYGAYYRRPIWTDLRKRREHVFLVRGFIRLARPLYVYTYASRETLEKRILARGESLDTQPSPDTVHGLFLDMFELVGISNRALLAIDTTGDPPVTTLARIVESRIKTLEDRRRS